MDGPAASTFLAYLDPTTAANVELPDVQEALDLAYQDAMGHVLGGLRKRGLLEKG